MPIYSNLYANLARQGITKTFTQGYAQSVVAATHPQVYASSNRPGFSLQRRQSKLTPFNGYHFHNAFHTSTNGPSLPLGSHIERKDHGLEAYFDAWKKAHVAGEPEKEWEQFQFAKRIEWQPGVATPAIEDAVRAAEIQEVAASTIALRIAQPLERAYSTSALEDIKKAELSTADVAALALVDAALEKEIQARVEAELHHPELNQTAVQAAAFDVEDASASASRDSLGETSSRATSVSIVSEQSQSYADHLSKLAIAGRYAEVPAVFESMLVGGIKPITAAYNALLEAAIHLPTERIQVVPKALEVYSDMLKRRVSPDDVTYDRLIGVLASRATEVMAQRTVLEKKRVRYGGMNAAGEFLFASHELEHQILLEDDRLDLALRIYDTSMASSNNITYSSSTYHELIEACSLAARTSDMTRIYQDMNEHAAPSLPATFVTMMEGHARASDLVQAIQRYSEYKKLAIKSQNDEKSVMKRDDAAIYAAVIRAYVKSGKIEGALKFYGRVLDASNFDSTLVQQPVVLRSFVLSLLERKLFADALQWSAKLEPVQREKAIAMISVEAADANDRIGAERAFTQLSFPLVDIKSSVAMLAMYLRAGDTVSALQHWQYLMESNHPFDATFVEPATMLAVAMIKSGQVADGLIRAEQIFSQIRSAADPSGQIRDQLEEGIQYIARYMVDNNLVDPRTIIASPPQTAVQSGYHDTFDPYAHNTDFKGSAWISDELERSGSGPNGKNSRLNDALNRLRNMRRAGRHPRYITYAKLITAAAREQRVNLVQDLLGMARNDIPLLLESAVVRYGWSSILDAMVGACLSLGHRALASQYHQELNQLGASPTANTFGLYITTLKESTKSFDEASEALQIFHRARSEGVEPSSFLYNALIGKLGKARRIDDCLLYFTEMRNNGIRPTSVTYGTIVNALCRVSDERFAEELFEEMESMPNYKPRPAPYNSLMQFFLTTKRDKSKVLAYYERMKSKGIEATKHTYKLLVDTHATLEPINMDAAEAVLDVIRNTGGRPEAVHYASLIHAKGCVLHDLTGARSIFDAVLADRTIRPDACVFQALLESYVANHRVTETEAILEQMAARRIRMTPYIANTLIHGWAQERNLRKCRDVYTALPKEKREPSTYEAMTRALLSGEARSEARAVVEEMLARGYPTAVASKICDLLGSAN